jgi:hypothetical protein
MCPAVVKVGRKDGLRAPDMVGTSEGAGVFLAVGAMIPVRPTLLPATGGVRVYKCVVTNAFVDVADPNIDGCCLRVDFRVEIGFPISWYGPRGLNPMLIKRPVDGGWSA